MARLYSNENFPLRVVLELHRLGHDVLTTLDAGKANQAIPDDQVLAFAVSDARAGLTLNRRDFIGLHRRSSLHAGIIVCTRDPDAMAPADRIHLAIHQPAELKGQLVRVIGSG